MAKANWVNVNPSQGSGNATVNVSSSSEHTGRVARTTILTWKAANIVDVVRAVNQAGKREYVDIDDAATADSGGKIVTISGESNSTKLTFSLGAGDLSLVLPESYIANSTPANNGQAINGDPGAATKYEFSISIQVPSNTTTEPQTRQIVVEDAAGNRDVCLLTLASGDAYITIAEGDIELDYLGTPVAVVVESNTTWTIE